MKNKKCVYQILNITTGKCYVGSTNDLYKRSLGHLRLLKNGSHYNKRLQKCWNEYGEADFKINVLEELKCDKIKSEQKWINQLKSYLPEFGFNIYKNAACRKDFKMSDREKLQRSIFRKGKPITKLIGHPGISSRVERYDLLGNLIDTHVSINQCSICTGVAKANIIMVLQGKIKQCNGYTFKRLTNPVPFGIIQ